MTAFVLIPGVTGATGTGLGILAWRNQRAVVSGDSPGTLRYLEAFGGRAASAPSTSVNGRANIRAPRAGTLRNFGFKFNSTPPVTTTATVYVNGVATSITATASGTTAVSDAVNTASVALGDSVYVLVSFATGTASNTQTRPQAVLTLV